MKSLFLQIHKNLTAISRILLIFWVFSFFSHGAHFDIIAESSELQECHLCQHHIDTPEVSPLFSGFSANLFLRISVAFAAVPESGNLYLSPPLRAPPVYQ
ncbi:hypothetical protein [Thalassomonas sp. RHCl1]|uniref:hypothetical protein n=1 Tax=Thalassomonas sp. RHCl1 TaxID=2995320 RepID=UPI00248C25D7|nr:hypothetical protein [Thalassomonas sp. RHCl1]